MSESLEINSINNCDKEIPLPPLVSLNYTPVWSKTQERYYFVDKNGNKSWEIPDKPKLPEGWKYKWSIDNNKFYFWNKNVNNGKTQWKYPIDSIKKNKENIREEAQKHLKFHKNKYNESIEKQIKEIEKKNKQLRKEFNDKWDKIDQDMEDEKMEVFDCGDNLSQDYINRLHNQCDDKVEEENYLIMNENESLDIFFGEKMEQWMKWIDVYNNRKNSSDTRPLWKVLSEDYPVPEFNTNDYEYEEMTKHSWYEEWEKSLEEYLNKM